MSEYHDACSGLVSDLANEFLVGALTMASEAEVRNTLLRYIRRAREAKALRAKHLAERTTVRLLAADIADLGYNAHDLTSKGTIDLREKTRQLCTMLAQ